MSYAERKKDIFKLFEKLSEKITEIYDVKLANEITEIYEDLAFKEQAEYLAEYYAKELVNTSAYVLNELRVFYVASQ